MMELNKMFEAYPNLEYNLMPDLQQKEELRKKSIITDASVNKSNMNESTTIQWRERDIKALEDFCQLHGIEGFNCGYMSPSAALAMLKSKLGIINTSSLDEQFPIGYESIIKKKVVMHG